MRRTVVALALLLAAASSVSACGEITAFCMTAGAPGVRLVVTTTPSGLQCSQVFADSLPRPTASASPSPDVQAPSAPEAP